MARHFFLNYGGPGGEWSSNNVCDIDYLDRACQETYGESARRIHYNIKGIDVTVCAYGCHRALYLELPDGASLDTFITFEEAKEIGLQICKKQYSFLGNNCVTAVANVLHYLDNRITPANLVWPWNLDNNVKKYGKYYPENTIYALFIAKYTEIVHREFFPFLRMAHWHGKIINSCRDIIAHAYGRTEGTGERTKSTLLELGWIKEDKKHNLLPTEKSPSEFKIVLEEFNREDKNRCLFLNLIKSNVSFFSLKTRQDSPTPEDLELRNLSNGING